MSIPPAPAMYIPHGGGPLPVLGDRRHAALVSFLGRVREQFTTPTAIVVVSAHWESDQATVTAAAQPALLYDYSGFPPESYSLSYHAPGSPSLATDILERLAAAGLPGAADARRGFDHGLFIPLMLMYPDARIPCVQLSLLRGLDPARHVAMGRAIADLRTRGVLILGSGFSFHNLPHFFGQPPTGVAESEAFHRWLIATATDPALPADAREDRLIAWERAPSARFCHPRAEHLLPLHVCFGAAGPDAGPAEVVFDQPVMDKPAVALLWR